jgi:hypothetical protein
MSDKISIELLAGKKVRKEIPFDDKQKVIVYNYTPEQAEGLIQYQEELKKDNPDITDIPDREALYLISELTNIDLSAIDNELKVFEIINNPSPVLKEVLREIDTIINEINRDAISRVKNDMRRLENMIDNIDVINSLPEKVLNVIENKDVIPGDTNKKINKILELSKKNTEKEKMTDEEIEQLKRLQEKAKKSGISVVNK